MLENTTDNQVSGQGVEENNIVNDLPNQIRVCECPRKKLICILPIMVLGIFMVGITTTIIVIYGINPKFWKFFSA